MIQRSPLAGSSRAVERALASGWFILGKELARFEEAWVKFCGAKHAVGVANGMEALEIGLRCLDLGPGDEIITTPMTAMATVMAILRVGAPPVLAESDPATALLDPASVERCITPKTKAVLLVHLYGQIRDMEHWQALCQKHRILLLEDCAQAHGAVWNGKAAGTFGPWGAYSFYPTKNLGARGDGGALITNDDTLTARAKMLRNYGQERRYEHREIGFNSRLDEVQAALLTVRLGWLETFNARRVAIAQRYFAEINNPRLRLPAKPAQDCSHVYHLFVVRCAERDRLATFLKERGIETLIHYPLPAHRQEFWTRAGQGRVDPQGLPNADRHAAECLSLPCHPQLDAAEAGNIIAAVNDFA